MALKLSVLGRGFSNSPDANSGTDSLQGAVRGARAGTDGVDEAVWSVKGREQASERIGIKVVTS